MIYRLRWCISTHILTKRMTTLSMSHRNLKENFNSHPHEEDDFHMKPCADTQEISTHILTKRMTIAICSATAESLFQLTSSRRGWQRIRTASIAIEYFNSHPHEEDDIYATDNVIDNIHFNSHPHEEDDSTSSLLFSKKSISTHILTKRMTAILNKNNLFEIAYYINNKHFISIVDIFFHFHIYF